AANLDEVASKAELLYGNCVSDDGTTDFGKVVSLVDAAKKANVGVFGSALISNTNQRPKYYQSLFEKRGAQIKEEKRKEREAKGGQKVLGKVTDLEASKFDKVAWRPDGIAEQITFNDGVIEVNNPAATQNFWDVQYNVIGGINTKAGVKYTVTINMKGSAAGKAHYKVGNWSEGKTGEISFTEDWSDVVIEGNNFLDIENGFLMLQHGDFVGTVYIKSVTIAHEEEVVMPSVEEVVDVDVPKITALAWDGTNNDANVTFNDGVVAIETPQAAANFWNVQYNVIGGINTKAGVKYAVIINMKGTSAGKAHYKVGNWSEGKTGEISFTDDWSDVVIEGNNFLDIENGFLMLQHGDFVGTVYIKSVKVVHYEEVKDDEPTSIEKNIVENSDCEGSENGNYVIRLQGAGGDVNASFSDGGKEGKCIKIDVAAKTANAWDNQFFITVPDYKEKFDPEAKVSLVMDVKAAVAQKISVQTHVAPGDYVGGFGDINAETDWKTFTLKASMPKHAEKGQSYSLAFNLNDGDGVANTFYFDNIKILVEEKIPAGEIAPEEKSKVLVNVIENWVSGLMTNTAGYVKAWDVVSDPISDGAVQKDGAYGLQSTEKPNTKKAYNDVFFWQDYLGDVDYVRYAVSAARRNFKGSAGELKLFVNEYGLDTDAKKCESLVKWLGKWENDTVKIDGVGVQLHLTCSENATENETTLSNLATMFQTLAATGKLVRVSELDVVYTDNSGSVVKVSSADYTAKNCDVAIGDFYKNVIKAYLANVPSAQQYGICQWSLTDEGDSPKGLWTDKFLRKQAYSGFANGLSGK
ncbi:MAG: endo-1,4-beta-xylanase, partial [Bacteroidales bacterium]|nr:endo-1,4-beta-xylanase [Bacteroidales bacterium]